MRRIAIAVVVAAAVAIVIWAVTRNGTRGRGDPSHEATSSAAPAATASVAAPGSATARTPPSHTIRLDSPAERAAVAQDIASANATRATRHSAPAPPHLPDDSLSKLPPGMVSRLSEAIPYLAACYRASDLRGARTARVQLTLNGSPDIGTLIDPEQLHDGDGKPLDPNLEGCLRSTLESLELPPMNATGVKLEYSFAFGDDDLR